MKFAHLADCHLGSWKDAALQRVSSESFIKAIDISIAEHVDFVLICGDLFNTALPPVESIKTAVEQLKKLHDLGIRVYCIAGSHDYSPSGKTILDVIESAGLCINVSRAEAANGKLRLKFTEDKTGVKIAGILGKRGGLDKMLYESIEKHTLNVEGEKIFLFHGALAELKPEDMEIDAMPVSLLPQGFNYYAGGHVHITRNYKFFESNIVYPGPTFPNSFSELEKLKHGNFCIVENWKVRNVELNIRDAVSITIDCNNKNAAQCEQELLSKLTNTSVSGAIILLRMFGTITEGKITDIPFNAIVTNTVKRGAYAVLKNTLQLRTQAMQKPMSKAKTPEEIETDVLTQNIKPDASLNLETAKILIQKLNTQKGEGETNLTFEKRLQSQIDEILGI